MSSSPEKETVKCMKCDYEFLTAIKDSCPKCGNKTKIITIDVSETVDVSCSLDITRQKEQSNERKIVNWPLKIVLVVILIGSPILGYYIADIYGAIIGVVLDLVAWFLEKYAEKRYIEKTIERDHYHE
nr:hypothetical protein [uncultured Methanoregula sp.]